MSFFKRSSFTVSSPGQLVAVGLTIVLTIINTRGVEEGRLVQNVFTVAKGLGLLLLIVLGLTVAAEPDAIRHNLDNVWGGITQTASYAEVAKFAPWPPLAIALLLSGAMVGALFSSDAWNNVTFIAGEVKNPQRTLPWGLFLGTGSVIVLYLAANVAYLSALPINGTKEWSPRPLKTHLAAWHRSRPKDDRVGTAVLEEVSPNLGAAVPDGGHHHDLDVRLRQRSDADGGPAVLCDGPRRPVLPIGRGPEPARGAAGGAVAAMRVVDRADFLGQLQ